MSEETPPQPPRAGCAAPAKEFLSLLAPLAWPLIVLLLLLYLHTPLYRAAESVSKKVDQATEIGIRDVLTLKIQEKAKVLGGEALAAAVGNLSPEALERLLHIGEAYFSVASVDQTHPRWLIVGKLDHLRAIDELVRAGLVSYRWNNREGVAFSELGAFLASRGFHCISVDPDGTTTYEADRDVAPADIDQLRQFQYHLTEKGTFARSAVIKTVVEILEATKAPQK